MSTLKRRKESRQRQTKLAWMEGPISNLPLVNTLELNPSWPKKAKKRKGCTSAGSSLTQTPGNKNNKLRNTTHYVYRILSHRLSM